MSQVARKMAPFGTVRLQVIPRDPFNGRSAHHVLSILAHGLPRFGLSREVNLWRLKNIPHLWRGLWRVWLAEVFGIATHYGAVFARVQRGVNGPWTTLGLASLRVITTSGVTSVATRFAGTSAANIANFLYHGYGTGTNAEASANTALQTELTTEYAVNNTRPTGSQSASTNTYTTVGTLSPDANVAITEHGILDQASNAGGTLLDRSVFSAVNLVGSADSLQVTYVLTLTAGG